MGTELICSLKRINGVSVAFSLIVTGIEMVEDRTDERSSMARGFDWASKIFTVSLCFVLPAFGGYFIDQWLGTKVVFVLIGLAFGMATGISLLIRIAKSITPSNISSESDD